MNNEWNLSFFIVIEISCLIFFLLYETRIFSFLVFVFVLFCFQIGDELESLFNLIQMSKTSRVDSGISSAMHECDNLDSCSGNANN